MQTAWVVLMVSVPPHPSSLRVRVWRKLRALGAVALKKSVYILPFTPETFEFIRDHDRVYVIEQNRDGQMWDLLRLETETAQLDKIRSIRHYSGMPIDAQSIVDDLIAQERKTGKEVLHV